MSKQFAAAIRSNRQSHKSLLDGVQAGIRRCLILYSGDQTDWLEGVFDPLALRLHDAGPPAYLVPTQTNEEMRLMGAERRSYAECSHRRTITLYGEEGRL